MLTTTITTERKAIVARIDFEAKISWLYYRLSPAERASALRTMQQLVKAATLA